jgi:hypothetical protein
VQRNLDEAVFARSVYHSREVIRTVNPSREMNCAPFTNVISLDTSLRQRRVGNLVFSEERVFLDAEQLDVTVYSQETTEGIRLTKRVQYGSIRKGHG